MTPSELLDNAVLWSILDNKPYAQELRECLEAFGSAPAANAPPQETSVPSAASRPTLVPKIPAEPFPTSELDGILTHLRDRMLAGRDKYAGSFCEADLKADVIEELLDASAYFLLMAMRLERALPEFEGPNSNDWMKGER